MDYDQGLDWDWDKIMIGTVKQNRIMTRSENDNWSLTQKGQTH